ncbi:MAG: hypothetical protein ACLPH3_06095 [Terracidiphilus sp.]
MHILTNCDTTHSQSSNRKKAAAVRNKRNTLSAPLVAVETAIRSEIEMEKKRPARLTFAEDFLFEHSSSVAPSVGLGVLSRAGKSNIERSVPSQFFGFPS